MTWFVQEREEAAKLFAEGGLGEKVEKPKQTAEDIVKIKVRHVLTVRYASSGHAEQMCTLLCCEVSSIFTYACTDWFMPYHVGARQF